MPENGESDSLAALLRRPLGRLRSPLAWYIRQGHRRRIQQGADNGLELVLGNFGDIGHGTIVCHWMGLWWYDLSGG